jgi:hypothetical protein
MWDAGARFQARTAAVDGFGWASGSTLVWRTGQRS